MTALAVDLRPIGLGDQRHATIDDPADDPDMAERQPCRLGEDDDGADARLIAALILTLRLIPPRPGVTVNLDARGGTRERHALADIIEQRRGLRRQRRHHGRA